MLKQLNVFTLGSGIFDHTNRMIRTFEIWSQYLAMLTIKVITFSGFHFASFQLFTVTRGWFHQHVYEKLLHTQILIAKKDSQVISVFLCFWDLQVQTLLVNCWWNWVTPACLNGLPLHYKYPANVGTPNKNRSIIFD